MKINSPDPLFSAKNENLPNPITVREAIGGLPELETDSGQFEINCDYKSTSPYESLMMGEINFKDFYDLIRLKKNIQPIKSAV